MCHSKETKAAVMAELLQGQSVSAVARKYKLPRTTVQKWRSESADFAGRTPIEVQRERIGALVVEYLIANLETLKAQLESLRDPDWLKRQEASELAVLHGVLADKSIRLLEALTAGTEEESGQLDSVSQ